MEKKKSRHIRLELSHFALHLLGGGCLLAGCLGAALQSAYFATDGASASAVDTQLLHILDSGGFDLATAAVFCQLAELAAIPIFSFLLVNGALRTASFGRYMLRVLGLAALCEVPYSLLYNGVLFTATNHNAVFGAVMALAMLWFFKSFPQSTAGHIAVKALALLGCFLWCNFLGVTHGAATVLVTAVLWATRGQPIGQMLAGVAVCLALVILSPVYFVSALGLIAVHMYSGKKGFSNRAVTYLLYPAALIVSLILSRLLG